MKSYPPPRSSGMALIIVLSCLLLISALVLAFFSSVTTETKASRLADNGARARELVDTTTNIVMAQIRAATTRGSEVAWASQPGMIRTYGTAGSGAPTASSAPLAYYKLYSAKNMVWEASSGAAFNATEDIPANWHTSPALYSDLNKPVQNMAGGLQYPILDPRATAIGFSLKSPPLATGAADVNPAPMPVRWLYVLKSGALTSPTGESPGTEGRPPKATWTGAPPALTPTKENPIVGRVAFWTDDESSKLNINTAVGDEWASTAAGSYWDVPHLYTTFDKDSLAIRQPAQFEYQRYPGHPATTYLSAVFANMTTPLTRDQIGAIVPRVETGGSAGGTIRALGKASMDNDRLYASVDELIFNKSRTAQAGLTQEQVEWNRFFLTANSRAPEINLFNKPRVSIWPVHNIGNAETKGYRTVFDELIAFCSRMGPADGKREYFFKRADAYSPTSDYDNIQRNRQIYAYLQNLTSQPIPGYGERFTDKYPQDRDQILTQIFDYIRSTNLFDDSLEQEPLTYPTKGKQFTKGRTSVTGGAVGHGQATPIRVGDTMGFGRFDTISELALNFVCTADHAHADSNAITDTQATPGPPATEAKLRNKTLGGVLLNSGEKRVEAVLLMELFSAAHGWTSLCRDIQIEIEGLNGLSLKGAADSAAIPMGFPSKARMYITQTSQGTIHGRGWGGLGGFRTHMRGRGMPARGVMPKDGASTNMGNTYPFISAPITIKPGTNNRMFLESSGPITIRIYAGGTATSPSTNLVQTIQANFAGHRATTEFPAPNLVTTPVSHGQSWMHGTGKDTVTTKQQWWSYARDGAVQGHPGRVNYIGEEPGRNTNPSGGGEASGNPIRANDTVRSIVPLHGDYRLIAANHNVPAGTFVPHQYYFDLNKRLVHSMTEVLGSDMIYGAIMEGKLVKDANYSSSRRPDVPAPYLPYRDPSLGPWGSDSGDWDTGIGHVSDGAYINKPDEGSAYDGTTDSIPYFNYTERHQTAGPTFFSPNRQVMSPVMFGSLPSQLKANQPWRTLLFRPEPQNPNGGTAFNHIGARSPKDHLLLDLFWMPVVEPYAISEPFSTAGKVNMNYRMMPFSYIERSTGIRALLRSERVTAIPFNAANAYKANVGTNYRHLISAPETLKQFETRFDGNDLFRSASEICELHLVPETTTLNDIQTYLTTNRLVGDNMKERPYATLYPRLTTKSNTYTVHYRVQALQQGGRSRGNDGTLWATWEEGRDAIVSETRGSTLIERYIDPADPTIVDYADPTVTTTKSLDAHYRFRVLNTRKFAP